MKKLILKFWMINVLISITLFVIYRLIISQSKSPDSNWLETFLYILEIFANIGFSILYLIVTLLCSLTFFLNLIENIRTNYYLSLLSFIGIPLGCIVFLTINFLIDYQLYSLSIIKTLLIFSTIYLLTNLIEFLMFRKKLIIESVKI